MNVWEKLMEGIDDADRLGYGHERPNVSKLITSSYVSDFDDEDWMALALVAVDQAGFPTSVYKNIEKLLQKHISSHGTRK